MLPGGSFATLLRHSAAGLAALALEGSLGLRLAEQMRHRTGRSPSPAEITSWDRSLPVLAQDLLRAGLDRVEVLVEHHLPLTSKRADVVLAGAHPQTGQPSYVVVELKQWSSAIPWEDDPELVLVPGTARPHLHPVAQVRGYCDYLVDFTSALQDVPDAVAGVAYLHNATDEGGLVDFLLERLDPTVASAPFADLLLSSAIAPSRQLLAVAADEVQRREQFILLAEQKLAYSLVLHESNRRAPGTARRSSS